MKKTTKKKVVKKTPATLLKVLTTYKNVNGIAKTAVALGMNDVNSIRNWISRKDIPATKRDLVKGLKDIVVTKFKTSEKVTA